MQENRWQKYVQMNDIQADDLRTIADEAGLEDSIRIITALRGLTLNIPKKPFKKAMERYILAKYDGTRYSLNKLAIECDMTQRQVAKIIRKNISKPKFK